MKLCVLRQGLAVFLCGLAGFVQSSRADLVFSDGTFNNAHWSITLTADSNNASAAGTQIGTGGNPGAFRDVTHTVTSSSGLIQAFHLRSSFIYDPGVSGAINSFDWSIDFNNVQGGQAVALAFEQNGGLFLADVFVTTAFGTGAWHSLSLNGITADDFSGTGGMPDWSAAGAPITFGYFTANSGQVGVFQTGFDNLMIALRPVPEPVALLTAVLAVAMACARCGSRRA